MLKFIPTLAAPFATLAVFAAPAHGPIDGDGSASAPLYVDDDAPPGGDGRSWATAFPLLQDALAAARQPMSGVTEIRIAQGVYKPDQGGGAIAGDKNSSFDLVSGVTLAGGYAGLASPTPDERDWAKHPTVLSGDLLGNDRPNFVNYEDNAWRVIRSINMNPAARMQGLVITAGDDNSGDLFIGAGVYCYLGALIIEDCRFEFNKADVGGAIGLEDGALTLRQCVFESNYANFGGAIGIRNFPALSDLDIENCQFFGNGTFEDGGAIYLHGAVNIRRSLFFGNFADDGGAVASGGGVIADCVFLSNGADYGGAIGRGGSTYIRCRFESNFASTQGGAYYYLPSPTVNQAKFINCDFVNNRSGSSEGGAARGGAQFINCRFLGNRANTGFTLANGHGGAIHVHGQGSPVLISGCEFSANTAHGRGGAIDILAGSNAIVTNCSFAANLSSLNGSAINGAANVCNAAFTLHAGQPLANITSIDHSCLPLAPPITGVGNIIADPRFVNPLGPDGVAGTEDDDLRLRSDSPCIDAGDTTALPADTFDIDGDGDVTEPLPLDLRGNARALDTPSAPDVGIASLTTPIPGAIVDMGAHEHRRPGDIAPSIGDGAVNVSDLVLVVIHWGDCPTPAFDPEAIDCIGDTNADGVVNVHDLLTVVLDWG